ncbi:MAG: polysaccharide deacetylase family protein [Pseudomonadota bacterium]
MFGLQWLIATSALASEPTQTDYGLVILQYHHIDDDTPASTSTSPAVFSEHLDYLADNDYAVIDLPAAVARLRSGQDLAPRTVAITFDDAFDSIYHTALPLLVEHDMPFTVFVSTDYLNRPHYMTTAQMREMQSQGASFANHTRSHIHLQRYLDGEIEAEWETRIREEIEGAEQILIDQLAENHKLLAYPYGEYNLRVLEIIDDLGYTAFGQQSGPASRHSDFALLPRFPMGGPYSSMRQFPTKVASLPMPLVETARLEPLTDQARPVLNLSLSGDRFRLHQLACFAPGGTAEVTRDGSQFTIRGPEALSAGRSRYNCTMPVRVAPGSPQTYHWFSQLWLKKRADGSWHPD